MSRCACGRIATEQVTGRRAGRIEVMPICLGCAWQYPLHKTVDGLRVERIEPLRRAVA